MQIQSNPKGTPCERLVGQRLDEKSNPCPISVKPLSNACPIGHQIQGLSSACQKSVKFWSALNLSDKDWIQKSNVCPKICPINDSANNRFLYLTKSGQTLEVDNLWTKLGLVVVERDNSKSLDKLWTYLIHRQTLDIPHTWTNSGQNFYCVICGPRPTANCTDSRQNIGHGQTLWSLL